jgi:hypothetical protein
MSSVLDLGFIGMLGAVLCDAGSIECSPAAMVATNVVGAIFLCYVGFKCFSGFRCKKKSGSKPLLPRSVVDENPAVATREVPAFRS